MSEKLLLELYERIVTLEEKVTNLENTLTWSKSIDKSNGENIGEVKGKYRYLSDYLLNSNLNTVDLTFNEIEDILQEPLPPSSRQHRALWANTKSHSIALSWLNVGYRSASVDMENEKIRFEKVRVIK